MNRLFTEHHLPAIKEEWAKRAPAALAENTDWIGTPCMYYEAVVTRDGTVIGYNQVDAILIDVGDPPGKPDDGSVIVAIGVETSSAGVYAVQKDIHVQMGDGYHPTRHHGKRINTFLEKEYYEQIGQLIDEMAAKEIRKSKAKLTLVAPIEPNDPVS